MYSNPGKFLLVSVLLISMIGVVSAGFSIETSDGEVDHNVVSPEAHTIQVVQLLEGDEPFEGDELESRDDLEFVYEYNGTSHDMSPLEEGYYYAEVDVAEMEGGEVTYELQDSSPTGGDSLTVTEEISEGQLDLDILTDFSGTFDAGSEIELEAEVENLAEYFAVDADGSGEVTDDSVFVIERGGDGTYSASSDEVLAGEEPEDGDVLDFGNPWSDSDHPVAFYQDTEGNDWDENNDIIVVDRYDGGTLSTEADEVVNTGQNDEVDAEEGQELHSSTEVEDEVYIVGSEIHEGVDVVYDNDSSGQFTVQPDELLAGTEPFEGRELMDTDSVPEEMNLNSYTPEEGTEWSSDDDIIAVDHDESGQYTARADEVLAGEEPEEGAELESDHVEAWEEAPEDDPETGDLRVYDHEPGEPWDEDEDAIWLDTGDENDGFTPDEDIPLAGNVEEGLEATEFGNQFNQWPRVAAYHSGSDGFDTSEDAIVIDYGEGETFSARSDTVVAGSFSEDFEEGTDYTTTNGLESEWTLGVVQQFEDSEWDENQDAIVRDFNEGGTYSKNADEVINHGGQLDAEGGETLTELNSVPEENLMWADNDDSGEYSPGDELIIDHDESEQYTAQPDERLAGSSLDQLENGKDLQESNPWSANEFPIGFIAEDTDYWNETDSIIHDTDGDGVYTARSDLVVEGDHEEVSPGDPLLETDRDDIASPDITAFITNGNTSTATVELGRGADGVYVNTLEIPEIHDSEMVVQFHADTPRGDVQGSASRLIETRSQGIGFTAESDIDLDVDRAGTYEETVTVENLLENENEIFAEASESIEDIVEFDPQIELESEAEENLTVEFDLVPAVDAAGEITFTENSTGESEEINVEVRGPTCVSSTDRFCVSQSDWLNTTTDERGTFSEEFTVSSIWTEDEDVDLDIELSGDIAEYATLSETEISTTDSETVTIEYEVEEEGEHTGEVSVVSEDETLTFPVGLESNVQDLETGFSISPQSFDFGHIPAGENVADTLEIENTGTLELTDFEVDSDYVLEADDVGDLEPEASTEIDFTIEEPQEQQGDMTLEASSEEESVSESADISLTIVTPEDEMTDDISSTVSDLRSRAQDEDVLNDLTDVEMETSSIETAYSQGDYQDAEQIYQSAQSDLESIENTIEMNEIDRDTGNGNGDQDTGTDPEPPVNGGTGDEGDGGGLIVFLLLLILILGAGFVVYTSYYPEEGDPLYSVLGEDQ